MSFNIFFFFSQFKELKERWMRHYKIASCLHGLADSRWSSGVRILVFGGSVKPAGDFLIGRWLVRKVGLLPGDL